MQDEDKLQRAHNEVPTHDELNQRLARSEAELATFRAIDADMDCTNTPLGEHPILGSCCQTLPGAATLSHECSTLGYCCRIGNGVYRICTVCVGQTAW